MTADKKWNRRQFLKSASLSLPVMGAAGRGIRVAESRVKTVTLGKTGMKVSNIGYGTSRGNLDPSIIVYAVQKGINYFDTSEGYGRGGAERNLGKAVKKIREQVHITTKVGSVNAAGRITRSTSRDEILQRARGCLERLDTPYIDCLSIHNAGDPDLGGFDNPHLHDVVRQLKTEGRVKHFGLSCHHHNLIDVVKHAAASDKVDTMLLAYSFFQRDGAPKDWLEQFDAALELAKSKNIGITVMKTLQGAQGSGAVAKDIDKWEGKKAAAKWALNRSHVDVAVLSLASITEIDEMVGISEDSMSAGDWDVLSRLSGTYAGLCPVGCPAPCLDPCPAGVAIPDVMRMGMYFSSYGWEKEAMLEYGTLHPKRNAEPCKDCSRTACSQACSFDLDVKTCLLKAHENLSF
jgi:predicted aldo/keto reductase-like oxidoreductase